MEDARNYTITNLKQKKRRMNPDSSTDDLNENDVDFDVQLGDDHDGNPVLLKVDSYKSLGDKKIVKMDYLTDEQQTVNMDDVVCKEFRGKSKFKFIFSLSDLHKYRYEVKLDKGKELTYRRMFKIICQSAKNVLNDTLEFLGGSRKQKNPDIIGDEIGDEDEESEDDVPTENNSNNMSGGFMGRLFEKIFGGGKLFNVNDKLKELEVEYVGVQKSGNRIFVEFSGFDKEEGDTFVL
jgi:hypothetical protein